MAVVGGWKLCRIERSDDRSSTSHSWDLNARSRVLVVPVCSFGERTPKQSRVKRLQSAERGGRFKPMSFPKEISMKTIVFFLYLPLPIRQLLLASLPIFFFHGR